ncbi:phage tail tape measure protein [Alkalicoccus luteus]|uniref:Phage tail tape measure protein n=1 Tax=Alkalicoccus luteus TaxID=1237094 RepID=A0A969PR12_9BACI|nr:phage tail tape measure protein [Alkalicoccus luteus]NJP38802.1 phage tail tape measure protein [Alkalicoccus luteus]
MEIQPFQQYSHESRPALREGETVRAVITERVSDREAVVQIRGREVTAVFEGRVPSADTVKVDITGVRDGKVSLRASVPSESADRGRIDIQTLIREAGGQPTAKSTEAVRLLQAHGRLTSENIQAVVQFVSESRGGSVQAVQQAVESRASISGDALDRFQRALQSSPAQALQQMMAAGTSSNVQSSTYELRQALPMLLHAYDSGAGVREAVSAVQQSAAGTAHAESVNQLLRSVLSAQVQGGRSAAADIMRELIFPVQGPAENQPAASLRSTVENMIQNTTDSSQLNQMRQVLSLLDKGKEVRAAQLFQQLQSVHTPDRSQAASPVTVMIREVTPAMASAKDQFQVFQREASRSMARMELLIERFQTQAAPQVRPMLEQMIQQLDKTINRSSWLLFATMKQERTLLKASSDLAQAKQLVSQGQLREAAAVAAGVRQTIEQMEYKPSAVRYQHVHKEPDQQRPIPQQLRQLTENTARTLQANEHSGRHVLEALRQLGFNRELDLVRPDTKMNEDNRNVKGLLGRMVQSGGEQEAGAQRALAVLNGHQQVNRIDSQSGLMFHVPLILEEKMQELKIFVDDRHQGGLDWENIQLYFHLEAPVSGPLGIRVSVQNRQLAVSFYNDEPSFSDRLEPLIEKYSAFINEIGYEVKSIQSGPMETEAKLTKKTAPAAEENGKDGVDIKI